MNKKNKKIKSDIALPKSIISRAEYKRKFSLQEMYIAAVFAPRAMAKLIGNKRSKLVDEKFVERLHLAVTEVNGCALCSYGHAKMALRQGMGSKEIKGFLSGEGDEFIKDEEAKAIVFAQYFADSRAYPKQYAYDAIVTEYGEKKSRIILSAIQMITFGNIYGIPMSALQSRLKGKPYKGSSLFYELKMPIIGVLFLPIAIMHGFIRGVVGLSNKRFDKLVTTNRVSS